LDDGFILQHFDEIIYHLIVIEGGFGIFQFVFFGVWREEGICLPGEADRY
jgi:hypothetical protein